MGKNQSGAAMGKASRSYGSQLEQDPAIADRKKELANRLLQAKRKGVPDKSAPSSSETNTERETRATAPPVARDEKRAPGFPLHRADSRAPVAVHEAVERLAALLVTAAQSKEAQYVLLWPGSLKGLALAHAAATMSEWHRGNKRGLRTLIYPAKANFLQSLNHVTVDRKGVGALAGRMYEDPSGAPNPAVVVSMQEKDAFLTCLNSRYLDIDGGIDPTLGELLPHFFSDGEHRAWGASEGDLLRRVKVQLGDRHWTRALNEGAIRTLGAFTLAPDALLALGWRTPNEAIGPVLRRLRRAGRPDIVILDLLRQNRKTMPSWRAMAFRFLDELSAAFGDEMPGLLLMTDEPHVRSQLIRDLEKRTRKNPELSSRLRPLLAANQVGVAFPSQGEGLVAPNHATFSPPPACEFIVDETDRKAASVVAGFESLRNRLVLDQEKEVVTAAIGYLNRLAAMPSSTKVLSAWLSEVEVPMQLREAFSWPSQRAPLSVLANSPTFTESARLAPLIKQADDLWRAYENGTPFVRQLAQLIEEHTRGSERCTVVFTRPTARRLAERYFETFTYDGMAPGEGFEILKDQLRLIPSSALEEELSSGGGATLVFAGLDEEGLRVLMSDARVPKRSHVLLTARNASYLKWTLRGVIGVPGLSGLKVRMTELQKRLEVFADIDESRMSREDFVLPTFSFEAGLSSGGNSSDAEDPDAWRIVLEGGAQLFRNPHSTAYVYDPVFGHALTRGFRSQQIRTLKPGDRLFVMSAELRELTESVLRAAGVDVSHDKRFEQQLKQYHTRVATLAEQNLVGRTLSQKVESLIEAMTAIEGCPKDLPAATTMRAWIDAQRWLNTTFEENSPHAPRKEAHFKVLARALGMQDIEAIVYWRTVIQPMRGTRRADGRRVSDAYTDLLMEQESFAVHQRLDPSIVHKLFLKAQDNVYTVEAIVKREESQDV